MGFMVTETVATGTSLEVEVLTIHP